MTNEQNIKQNNKQNDTKNNNLNRQGKIDGIELCPLCAMPVSHDDRTCNHCGYVVNVSTTKTKNTNFLPFILGVTGGIFICAAACVAIINKKGSHAFSEDAQKTADIFIQEKTRTTDAFKSNISRVYSKGHRLAAHARRMRSSLANASSNISQARNQLDKATKSAREKLDSFASKNASKIGSDIKSRFSNIDSRFSSIASDISQNI